MATVEIPVAYDENEILDKLACGEKKYQLEALKEIAAMDESAASYTGYAGNVAAMVNDQDVDIVVAACEALGSMGEYGEPYMGEIAGKLQSSNAKVKTVAIGSLGMLGTTAAKYAQSVEKFLADDSASVRAAACIALGSMKATGTAGGVKKLLSDKQAAVVSGAVTALSLLDDDGACASEIAKKLTDKDRDVKMSAVVYFTKHDMMATSHAGAICGLLKDADLPVRQSVVAFCARLGSKAESMVPEIAKCLSDENASVKAAAALALGAIGSVANAKADNIALLLDDTSEDKASLLLSTAGVEARPPAEMRIPACAAAIALSQLKAESFAMSIADLLSSANPDMRIAAATALGDLGAKVEDKLAPVLDDLVPQAKVAALKAISKLAKVSVPNESTKQKVAGLLDAAEKNPRVKAAALEAMMNMGEECAEFTDKFQELFEERSTVVKCAAIRALGGVGTRGQCYAPVVCRQIHAESDQVRIAALETLAEMGERGAAFADEVADLLTDQDAPVRIAAIESLAKMGDAATPFMSIIDNLKNDPNPAVRDVAMKVAVQSAIGE